MCVRMCPDTGGASYGDDDATKAKPMCYIPQLVPYVFMVACMRHFSGVLTCVCMRACVCRTHCKDRVMPFIVIYMGIVCYR